MSNLATHIQSHKVWNYRLKQSIVQVIKDILDLQNPICVINHFPSLDVFIWPFKWFSYIAHLQRYIIIHEYENPRTNLGLLHVFITMWIMTMHQLWCPMAMNVVSHVFTLCVSSNVNNICLIIICDYYCHPSGIWGTMWKVHSFISPFILPPLSILNVLCVSCNR